VLKVTGKVATDMEQLNGRVLFVESLVHSVPILLELSFERLISISHLSNSVFLRPRIYPAVKYYLQQGEEERCLEDLKRLTEAIQQFKGLPLMVSLILQQNPLPNLKPILSYLRQLNGFVRFIVLSLERPPLDMVKSLQ
jgi:hypothetical protein